MAQRILEWGKGVGVIHVEMGEKGLLFRADQGQMA